MRLHTTDLTIESLSDFSIEELNTAYNVVQKAMSFVDDLIHDTKKISQIDEDERCIMKIDCAEWTKFLSILASAICQRRVDSNHQLI